MGNDDPKSFKEAFSDVEPLDDGKPRRVAPSPAQRGGSRPAESISLGVSYEAGGLVVGQRSGTHGSILSALSDSTLEPEASCDLHGRNGPDARREIARFVRQAHHEGKRWLLIIVGKGLHSPGRDGALQEHAIEALSKGAASRFVLAFRTAPRHLGGSGAITVRLADRL